LRQPFGVGCLACPNDEEIISAARGFSLRFGLEKGIKKAGGLMHTCASGRF